MREFISGEAFHELMTGAVSYNGSTRKILFSYRVAICIEIHVDQTDHRAIAADIFRDGNLEQYSPWLSFSRRAHRRYRSRRSRQFLSRQMPSIFSRPLKRVVGEDEPSLWQFAKDFPQSGFIRTFTVRTLESFWDVFADWPHFRRTLLCLHAIHCGQSRWISVYANMTARRIPGEKCGLWYPMWRAGCNSMSRRKPPHSLRICEVWTEFFNVLIMHNVRERCVLSRGMEEGVRLGVRKLEYKWLFGMWSKWKCSFDFGEITFGASHCVRLIVWF